MKKAKILLLGLLAAGLLSACGAVEQKTADGSGKPETAAAGSNEETIAQADISDGKGADTETEREEESKMAEKTETGQANLLGGMSPEDALEYMKTTENLVIVDVAATKWYDKEHFEGAVNIPIEELDSDEEDKLYHDIPTGRPVIMHCRLGMIVPGAYERVLELRPDIPEISYIDGEPPFEEYNEWLESR